MSDPDATQHGEEDNKEDNPNAPVSIKVATSDGQETFFKIKRSTKLAKLQSAYAQKVGKEVNSIRFLYEGQRISENDTPQSLDMQDEDTIDVMVEQVGGCSA